MRFEGDGRKRCAAFTVCGGSPQSTTLSTVRCRTRRY